jgi:uncharacterized Zn finger protein (UPF0148 family)
MTSSSMMAEGATATASAAGKKDPSALLGEKLLQGWTMLGDTCVRAGCEGVPLMRDRKTKRMLCVACNTQYALDGDSIVPAEKKEEEKKTKSEEAEAKSSAPASIPAAVPAAGGVVQSTLADVYAKMDECRTQLVKETTPQGIASVCMAIQELAKAASLLAAAAVAVPK